MGGKLKSLTVAIDEVMVWERALTETDILSRVWRPGAQQWIASCKVTTTCESTRSFTSRFTLSVQWSRYFTDSSTIFMYSGEQYLQHINIVVSDLRVRASRRLKWTKSLKLKM